MRMEEDPRIRPCRSCKRPELIRDMTPARQVRWFGSRNPRARGYYCSRCIWRMQSHGPLIANDVTKDIPPSAAST